MSDEELRFHNRGTPLWQGFDFSWHRAPHRLNHLTTALDPGPDEGDVLTGEHRVRFSVGRVPDRGTARTFVTGLRGPGLQFAHGTTDLDLQADLGDPASSRSGPVVVPLPPGAARGAAVLRGFEIACTSCSVGLHVQGFGLRLGAQQAADDQVVFWPEAYIHANNSPDLITGGRGPYGYRFRLLWTIIAGDEGELAIDFDDDDQPAFRHRHPRGRGPASLDPVLVPRDDRCNRAAVGIRGFRWEQRHRGRFGRDGRFLRRVTVALSGPEPHDDEKLAWHPKLWFSNDGLVPYPCESEHALWTTRLRWHDPGEPLPQRVLEAPIRTGIGAGAVNTQPWRLEPSRD